MRRQSRKASIKVSGRVNLGELACRTHADHMAALEAAGVFRPECSMVDRAVLANWLADIVEDEVSSVRDALSTAETELESMQARLDKTRHLATELAIGVGRTAYGALQVLELWAADRLLEAQGTVDPEKVDQDWLNHCKAVVGEVAVRLRAIRQEADEFDPDPL